MKYKNTTDENIKYKSGNPHSMIWKTVHPGEEIDLPWWIGEAIGLTKISDIEQNCKLEDSEKEIYEEIEEESEDEPIDISSYRKKLIDINGVGKKSADKIIKKYPTEYMLIAAIQAGEEIHNNDGIDKLVKDTFGGEA